MKVKENLSNKFKRGEYKNLKENEECKDLKEFKRLRLIEYKRRLDNLPYSNYLIYDEAFNFSYFSIYIPNPLNEKGIYKDIFLKYQTGVRNFLSEFFEIVIGRKIEMESPYKTKQPFEFEFEDSGDMWGSVLLKIKGEDKIFAIISFENNEINRKVANDFKAYFTGDKMDLSYVQNYGLILREDDGEWNYPM